MKGQTKLLMQNIDDVTGHYEGVSAVKLTFVAISCSEYDRVIELSAVVATSTAILLGK